MNLTTLKNFVKGDTIIWTVFFLLCLVSAVEMFSASSSLAYKSAVGYTAPILRHVMFLVIGIVLAYVVHLVPYRYFRMLNYVLLIVAFTSLCITLFNGVSVSSAKRWLDVGLFQFQPSELAKLSVIIFIADQLARKQQRNQSPDKAFAPIVAVMLVFCGLIFSENLSTALLIFAIGTLMMVIGRISMIKIMKLLGVLALFAGIAFFIGWKVPQSELPGIFKRLPTQVNRVLAFVDDDEDKFITTDANYQVNNAQIAIANGGVMPKMPGSSIQRDYLPEAYSDFIYAIVIEELGIMGGVFIIVLFLILLYRAGNITLKSTQTFPALMVIGLTLTLVIQAFVSMAVAVHLGPVTGQPLPLISRGGTSILVTCLYFGMILSVTRNNEELNVDKEDKDG